MASFEIVGPIDIPIKKGRSGRYIDKTNLADFWEKSSCSESIGCYVFALKTGRGTLPYYAGKTINGFKEECFTSHKLTKYHEVLVDVERGKPVMYFIILKVTRGRRNKKAIDLLEERIIGLGLQRNQRMVNISGTKVDELLVRGVMGKGCGQPGAQAKSFRAMMGIK